MTRETALFVRLDGERATTAAIYARKSQTALRRAQKQLPGDQSETVRYDALNAVIERCAIEAVWADAPYLETEPAGSGHGEIPILYSGHTVGEHLPTEARRWLAEGATVVELRLPNRSGTAPHGEPGRGPPPVLDRWRSESTSPAAAMSERFKDQLERAVSAPGTPDAVIRPSRITNSVLTENLRKYACAEKSSKILETPVIYQDASNGPSFPLRSAPLTTDTPEGWRELRFTLLSIRHVEMDLLVDGAWLRNARVSQPRAAGLTDRLVYETSINQLELVSRAGPVVIHMFQTGLETAVVGFYRAVLRQLISRPGSLAVIPRYFRGRDNFDAGTPWVAA